jgi:Ser/Thr protein kinase RdoA (MazF antagonist)
VRVARLIGAYHAAVASFRPPADARWQTDGRDPCGPAELICHNDLAPWNLVLGEPAWVFIDWDLAAPGRRLWDLALAACSFVPLWPDQPGGPRLDRYRLFCAAYGLADAESWGLLEVVVERTQRMADVLLERADREPYASLVRDGHAATWQRVAHAVERLARRWHGRLD